ncbi:MAG: EpsG family protein [Clostridia bacterium]|nr:EpsG family protein [Clostridia bacterium]
MQVYLFMILWIALVGFMSKTYEVTELIDGREEKRCNYTYSILMFAVIIFFTGLRSSVGDTFNYINNFNNIDVESTSLLSILKNSDGYQLYNAYGYIVKKYVSEDSRVYLFGIALISGIFTMIGYRRLSCNYTFSLILFMLSGKFVWMMNGIKQFAAAALMLMAFKLITAEEGRYKYFVYLFIAYLIHPSAIVILPAYFIFKGKPWSAKILVTIGLAILAITFVSEFTNFLDFATEDTVFDGSVKQFSNDDGSNIMRFFVAAVPPALALLKRKEVEKINSPTINVMINMSVLSACCYLVATFTSGILMGRVPLYFELTNFALLPWLLENVFEAKDRKIFKIACIVCYCVFFYFQVWGLEYTSYTLNLYLY